MDLECDDEGALMESAFNDDDDDDDEDENDHLMPPPIEVAEGTSGTFNRHCNIVVDS